MNKFAALVVMLSLTGCVVDRDPVYVSPTPVYEQRVIVVPPRRPVCHWETVWDERVRRHVRVERCY
jgi:hypothetical protein